MELPGISITEVDQQIFLQVRPDSARPAVDVAMLQAMLAGFGAGACALDETALAKAVEDCNAGQNPFSIPVAQRRDASTDIQISADDMQAELSVQPAYGGKTVSLDDLMRALTQSGVVFGIDDAELMRVSERNGCTSVPIARGTLPQDGCDAVFEALIDHPVNRAPKVNENGLIDYRERGSIHVVTPGMPLMRRHPATPGEAGRTVRGTVLSARPGHDEPFASDLAGAQAARDDANLLEARVAGQPLVVQCGVMVEPVLQLEEVNMATGNIHFDGTVQVKGDIVQGMKVEVSGDIVVAGMVDGGVLQAGGDILIAGGVIAHATLTAGGCVSARFAQDVKIRAGTILSLADAALECELESLNQIVIGAKSHGRGRLVGGSATAMMLLSVPVLGSSKAGVTRVAMGVNAELNARYAALLQLLEKEKANEESLEKLIKQVVATKDPKDLLPRIQASRKHALQVWGQLLAEKEALEQQMARALEARIELSAGLEGAVDLMFGTHAARPRREFSAGTFSLDPTELVVMFSDGRGSKPAVG